MYVYVYKYNYGAKQYMCDGQLESDVPIAWAAIGLHTLEGASSR